MVLVTSNKHQRLFCLSYAQRVLPGELESARDEIKMLLADLPTGFRVLADLSQMEFMDPGCAPEIGRVMDMLHQHGVSVVVRVIPDASKDIGMNILGIFHYPQQPRIITCQNLGEALRQLSLWG